MALLVNLEDILSEDFADEFISYYLSWLPKMSIS